MLILDAVPVDHPGNDRLHPAHSHHTRLHHGSEVCSDISVGLEVDSCKMWRLKKLNRIINKEYVAKSCFSVLRFFSPVNVNWVSFSCGCL